MTEQPSHKSHLRPPLAQRRFSPNTTVMSVQPACILPDRPVLKLRLQLHQSDDEITSSKRKLSDASDDTSTPPARSTAADPKRPRRHCLQCSDAHCPGSVRRQNCPFYATGRRRREPVRVVARHKVAKRMRRCVLCGRDDCRGGARRALCSTHGVKESLAVELGKVDVAPPPGRRFGAVMFVDEFLYGWAPQRQMCEAEIVARTLAR